MKKLIRLTESELKKLIKQSLTELNWKTYMNAAKKAHDNDDDRSGDFLDAAEDSYKNQYGAEDYDGYGSYDLGSGAGHNPYHELRTNSDGDYVGDGDDEDYVYQRTATSFDDDGYGPDVNSTIGDVHDSDVFDVARNNKYASSEKSDVDNASPEFNDVRRYLHGQSKYTKGKGWDQNESRRRKNTARLTESKLYGIIRKEVARAVKKRMNK